MKKNLLGFTSLAIGLSFLGCVGGSANLQPKTYTTKNITYKDYRFIKVDSVDNEKITTEEVKNYVKTHAYKFGRILKTTNAVYMHNSTTIETYQKFCVCSIITNIIHSSTPCSNFITNI